jgi:hypothetical protein
MRQMNRVTTEQTTIDMLDGDHYRTAELVNQLMNNAIMRHNLDLIESLKPELTIVENNQGGKAYCYDYKGIIIAGGETVCDAMMEFQRKFYSQKAGVK